MPSVTYGTLAVNCPAVQAPTTFIDPTATGFTLAILQDLISADFQSRWRRNFGYTEALGRIGAGLYGVGFGLVPTSADGGLVCSVSAGEALLDVPVPLAAATNLTGGLATNTDNYLWVSRSGILAKRTTADGASKLLPPSSTEPWAFLRKITKDAGNNSTVYDDSGVLTVIGGVGIRKVADTGMPGDTPPAGARFFTYSMGDNSLWWWDGAQYVQFPSPGIPLSGFIRKDGSVAFTANQSMGSHKLTNLTDPGAAQDAATRAYVDAAIAGEVPSSRQVIAGTGMTGGGDLSANRTLNVVANADGSIVANADDVQVGVLASDAQHGVRGGGTQHANAVASGAAGFMSGADKAKLDGVSGGATALGMLVFGIPGLVAQGVTAYLYPGVQAASATEIKIRIRVACTAKQMAVRSTAAPTTGTDVYTLRKNGTDTALTVTLGTSDTEDENTADSVSFSPGDDLSLKIVTGVASVSANPMVSLVLA